MKALEILREQKQIIDLSLECSKNDAVESEYVKAVEFNLNRINEAIKELEELENRSCESCKNCMYDGLYCELYESEFVNLAYKEKDFYCNKWEKRKQINGEER